MAASDEDLAKLKEAAEWAREHGNDAEQAAGKGAAAVHNMVDRWQKSQTN